MRPKNKHTIIRQKKKLIAGASARSRLRKLSANWETELATRDELLLQMTDT